MEQIIFKGTLYRNQTISSEEVGTFLFEGINTGNEEIKITKRSTSCGCTTVTAPKKVEPGETFYVQVMIDKRDQKGSFNQSATLTFSNGQVIKLKVNGTVE